MNLIKTFKNKWHWKKNNVLMNSKNLKENKHQDKKFYLRKLSLEKTYQENFK